MWPFFSTKNQEGGKLQLIKVWWRLNKKCINSYIEYTLRFDVSVQGMPTYQWQPLQNLPPYILMDPAKTLLFSVSVRHSIIWHQLRREQIWKMRDTEKGVLAGHNSEKSDFKVSYVMKTMLTVGTTL